ncbi:unnamed protein product [Penicillium pancosmium]
MPSGSCICGKLKYEFKGDPQGLALCYCFSCQKITGSTHTTNVLIPENEFSVTTGSEKTNTQTHETGMKLTLHFCGDCGGTIYKTADNEAFAGMAVVQVGTIDHPNLLQEAKPAVELFTKYRAPWIPKLDGAVQKAEF